MNWIIIINARVEKKLRKFPAGDYRRIREAINDLVVDPFWGDIEKLVDQENNWRRRVGNYRIFCEIFQEKKLVYIVGIKRRTSSTY